MKPVSLYVHIPFCASKCHYCSFNSVTGKSRFVEEYVAALIAEMDCHAPALRGRRVPTVFFGGGTPSLLSGEQAGRILAAARQRFEIAAQAEVTLEANPGTLDGEKPAGYRAAGVNRISMGVQSFHADELRWLGRTHGVSEVEESVAALRRAGFSNFNLDLIFGLPGQTLERWRESVRRAIALGPAHLSLYHLTIEEGSTFGDVKRFADPDDGEGARLFEWTREFLGEAGFEQYEISNFARPGFRCRHNEVYWKNEDCLGIGAGAWSYMDGARWLRPKSVEGYLSDIAARKFARLEEERLPSPASLRETLVFGLRTKDGVDLGDLRRRYGIGPDGETAAALNRLREEGLLAIEGGRVRLTGRGFLFADTVAVELL